MQYSRVALTVVRRLVNYINKFTVVDEFEHKGVVLEF